MAREIPEVVRAAAGLAATVLDEARKLPETLPGLPVRVIGLAMQQAMRVQQHYAGLVARGDELFTGLRGEDEPGMATFDDEIEESGNGAAPTGGFRESAFDRADIPLTEVHVDEDTADRTDLGDSDLPTVDLTEIDATSPAATSPAAPVAEKPVAEKPARKKAAKSTKADGGKAGAGKAGARKAARKAAAPVGEAAPVAETASAEATVADDAPVAAAAAQVEDAQQTLDALPAEAPSTEEVLEELAIEEMVGDATADITADVATTADVLTPDGEVAAVEATLTDEGVAAPEAPETPAAEPQAAEAPAAAAAETAAPEAPAAETPAAETPAAEAPAPETPQVAPIDGYDSFSIAQLRGRLRGYALSTVSDLVAYEQATKAREPYLRMLRNRLEKLEEQAVEASPLAPRGA